MDVCELSCVSMSIDILSALKMHYLYTDLQWMFKGFNDFAVLCQKSDGGIR